MDEAVAAGARVELGGRFDAATRYVAPTILTGVTPDMAIMREEIFGPILPVLGYDARADVIRQIQARDKPLALYVFGRDEAAVGEILAQTTAGGPS